MSDAENPQEDWEDCGPSLAEQHMGTCRHFRAITKFNVCRAGVPHVQFSEEVDDIEELPCFDRDNGFRRCPLAEFPTREEGEAYEREANAADEAAWARMIRGRERVLAYIEERGRLGTNFVADIPCPNCERRIHFGYAGALNGHIRALCTTPGCTGWVE